MRASTKECNGDDCGWWFRTRILESFKCRFSRRNSLTSCLYKSQSLCFKQLGPCYHFHACIHFQVRVRVS
ncbi:hypothetical protein Hanom_Chr08g00687561 [Helianthus anomalus]